MGHGQPWATGPLGTIVHLGPSFEESPPGACAGPPGCRAWQQDAGAPQPQQHRSWAGGFYRGQEQNTRTKAFDLEVRLCDAGDGCKRSDLRQSEPGRSGSKQYLTAGVYHDYHGTVWTMPENAPNATAELSSRPQTPGQDRQIDSAFQRKGRRTSQAGHTTHTTCMICCSLSTCACLRVLQVPCS